jgi:hypothetical protein
VELLAAYLEGLRGYSKRGADTELSWLERVDGGLEHSESWFTNGRRDPSQLSVSCLLHSAPYSQTSTRRLTWPALF